MVIKEQRVKENRKCWGILLNRVGSQAHQEGDFGGTDLKERRGKPCGYLEEKNSRERE